RSVFGILSGGIRDLCLQNDIFPSLKVKKGKSPKNRGRAKITFDPASLMYVCHNSFYSLVKIIKVDYFCVRGLSRAEN
ncbi:MAG: hypothetical protein IJA46_09030, partial [Bacteroidaceae bacterium]|nr:hypothetical protein [Bacteroidaceae bacterium]